MYGGRTHAVNVPYIVPYTAQYLGHAHVALVVQLANSPAPNGPIPHWALRPGRTGGPLCPALLCTVSLPDDRDPLVRQKSPCRTPCRTPCRNRAVHCAVHRAVPWAFARCPRCPSGTPSAAAALAAAAVGPTPGGRRRGRSHHRRWVRGRCPGLVVWLRRRRGRRAPVGAEKVPVEEHHVLSR